MLQDTKSIYFITDLAEKGDLADILKRSKNLDFSTTQFVVAEIVNALEYLHKIGVGHRDLKPDNLFVTESGHIKIVSKTILLFGLGRLWNCFPIG